MKLGTNLAGIAQWSTQDPFIDYFKAARPWVTQKTDVWDTEEQARLDVDPNGWVKSLPGATSTAQFRQVGTLVVPAGEAARPGKYVVLYDGVGEITYGLGGAKIDGESTTGRDMVQLVDFDGITTTTSGADQQPILIQISQTDPNNYIRNIRVYHESDLPLVETGATFRTDFLKNIKDYGSLRFMDWQNTNYMPNTPQSWEGRPRVDQSTWMTNGVPVEIMVELANLTDTNPWFTMPHSATDDYMRQFATYVRDNLKPGLVAYFEYSNEMWNWGFEHTSWAFERGKEMAERNPSLGWDNAEAHHLYYYGWRAARMGRLVLRTLRTAKIVFATQSSWQGLEQFALHAARKFKFDAYAIAPYFGSDLGKPEYLSTVQEWSREGGAGLVKAFEQIRDGTLLNSPDYPYGGSLRQSLRDASYHKQVAAREGMKLVAYEGGQHLVGVGTASGDTVLEEFFRSINRDPRMGQLYIDYLRGLKKIGVQLYQNFTDCCAPAPSGDWGNLPRWNSPLTPRSRAVKNFAKQAMRI